MVGRVSFDLDIVFWCGSHLHFLRGDGLLLHRGLPVNLMFFPVARFLPCASLHGCAENGGEFLAISHCQDIDRHILTKVTGHHGLIAGGRKQPFVAGQYLARLLLAVDYAVLGGKHRFVPFRLIHPGHGRLIKDRLLFRQRQHKFQFYPGFAVAFGTVP